MNNVSVLLLSRNQGTLLFKTIPRIKMLLCLMLLLRLLCISLTQMICTVDHMFRCCGPSAHVKSLKVTLCSGLGQAAVLFTAYTLNMAIFVISKNENEN